MGLSLGDIISAPFEVAFAPFREGLKAIMPQFPEPPAVAPAPGEIPRPLPTMPLPDDDAVRRAKRRSLADQRRRRGRQSTILTGDEPLGGPPL